MRAAELETELAEVLPAVEARTAGKRYLLDADRCMGELRDWWSRYLAAAGDHSTNGTQTTHKSHSDTLIGTVAR